MTISAKVIADSISEAGLVGWCQYRKSLPGENQ